MTKRKRNIYLFLYFMLNKKNTVAAFFCIIFLFFSSAFSSALEVEAITKPSADILLSFSEQDIYCEVTSPESLQKSIESKKQSEAKKVQNLLKKQPWMSKQDAEHEIKQDRITRFLLEKTNKQLLDHQ